jgi:hypothetical protein
MIAAVPLCLLWLKRRAMAEPVNPSPRDRKLRSKSNLKTMPLPRKRPATQFEYSKGWSFSGGGPPEDTVLVNEKPARRTFFFTTSVMPPAHDAAGKQTAFRAPCRESSARSINASSCRSSRGSYKHKNCDRICKGIRRKFADLYSPWNAELSRA